MLVEVDIKLIKCHVYHYASFRFQMLRMRAIRLCYRGVPTGIFAKVDWVFTVFKSLHWRHIATIVRKNASAWCVRNKEGAFGWGLYKKEVKGPGY